METVFLKLLNMSISAGWVILAVIFVRLVWKRAPKWSRCVLWGIVAFRLICPFSWESVVSLMPSSETIPEEIMYMQEPEIHSGVELINHMVNPVLSESLSPNPGDSVNPLQVWAFIASVLWLVGMAGIALYAFISYVRLQRKVAVSLPVAENIYICDYIDTPFILGMFCPRIYLPSVLEQKQVPYVILHEKAHLKRMDHLWKPLGYVLLTVYWFHPLMWVAYVLLCRDIELACDEKVIKELGEGDKKSYSDVLLECSVSRRMIMACPLAFGEVGVKERVKTVLSYKRPAFWMMIAAAILCVVVAVCFLTNPKEENYRASEPLGYTYRVESTEYTYGREMISSMVYITDYARYNLSADYIMRCKDEVGTNSTDGEWELCGRMQEVKLTEENFDTYFREWDGLPGWPMDFLPEDYRKNNENAWQILRGEDELSYYFLHQKSGEVYLVCWYYDGDGDNYADDSIVRWMFKLERVNDVSSDWGQEQCPIAEPTEEPVSPENPKVQEESENIPDIGDPLEAAIHDAILGRDAERIVEGILFPCESHVILGTETLCVCGTEDSPETGEYLTVYAMVLTQEYAFGEHGRILDGLGGHSPVAITFKVEGDEYILEEYWMPRDGSYYVEDIREKFPDDIEEEALDTQKFILAQMQGCYHQAVQFGQTETDAVIGELMDTILFRPKEESDVQAYIDAHSLEYRELIYYGMYTLDYCKEHFEKGGQMDLKGALMASVCQDIAEGYGWEQAYGSKYENGQEWYDGYGKEGIFFPLGLAEENPRKDWGITLSAVNVTGKGLELEIQQSGGAPTGSLQCGSDYRLMFREGDVFKMVPVTIDNYAWTAEAYLISMETDISFEIDWTWLYGTLPAGEYRLIKEIMDFRKSGDYDIEEFYVDFEIQ